MTIEQKRARLLEIIKERSLQYGDFVLRSGARSNFFLDGKGTTLSAEGGALVGEVMFELIRDLDLDAVGGLTLGADPIATAISIESWRQGKPVDAFVVRKETKDHGMGDLIAGRLKARSRVVIVEDTVTTGSAIQAAIEAVLAAGHSIVKIVAIVDRQAGAAENFAKQGFDYGWVFTLAELGVQAEMKPTATAVTPVKEDFPTEFADQERLNQGELRDLHLATTREPPTVFNPAP